MSLANHKHTTNGLPPFPDGSPLQPVKNLILTGWRKYSNLKMV